MRQLERTFESHSRVIYQHRPDTPSDTPGMDKKTEFSDLTKFKSLHKNNVTTAFIIPSTLR